MKVAVKPSKEPLTILLVEDDDGDEKAVRRAFRQARIGNEIIRAIDGVEALDMLRGGNGKTKPPSPRVMLVDVNMPRMNGIQFVQALRADEELRQSIVFILTTSNRDEDKAAAYDLNVAGYIVKARAAQDFQSLVTLIGSYGYTIEMP